MKDIATPTGQAEPIDLDDTDHAIIALLRDNGRMPYRAVARQLNVSENTVRARVRRMEESDTMRVVAVTDIEAAGFGMLLAIGVQVEGRSPEEVARAFLVRDAGVQLDEATVIAWARDNMANYKVPRSVVLLDELPMNAGGKVDKGALASGSAG